MKKIVKEESWYFIFRKYPAARVEWSEFGWTANKFLAKAFMMQRDRDKYRVVKADEYKLARNFGENQRDYAEELKMIKVRSTSGPGEYSVVTTDNELNEARAHILDMLRDLSALSHPGEEFDPMLLGAFMCLGDPYKEALDYIGFQPKEMAAMYQGDDESIYPEEEMRKYYGVGSMVNIPDYEKCLYSLEGLIAGLKEDF